MNFKKYFILVVVAAFALTACDTDKLVIEQQGVLTTSEYTTADDDGVDAFIAAIYSYIHGDSYLTFAGTSSTATWGYLKFYLNQMAKDTSDEFGYSEGAEGSTYSQIWSYCYTIIYWCNMVIENLPDNETASTSKITTAVAECRAIRAIMMSYLVQLYGTPPLADHIMDGTEGNTPADESWAWIETELEEAAEDLPTKSGLGGQSTIGGRMTKEAAYAFLGRAQLWQGNYSDAATTLYNKVISTGKYALNDNWSDLNLSTTSDFTDENIWEFDFNEDTASAQGQAGCMDLIIFAPAVTYWWSTYASLYMAWGQGSHPNQDYIDLIVAHDGTDSDRYNAQILDVCTASAMGGVSNPTSGCMGYFSVRHLCRDEDCVGVLPYWYSLKNTVFMRYAEVLLNYAEAVCQGGSSGSGLSGLEALNLVRNRAGLDDAPSLSMDNETYGIKAERRIELYTEGQRFIDLVRWGDAATELADCGLYTYTCTLGGGIDYSGITIYTTFEVSKSSTGNSGFKSGKNELFPIPQSDLNQNSNLTQNTGW